MANLQIEEREIRDGALFAALSYCLFLWILAFIFRKNNRYALFHAKQGIVIFIGETICVVLAILPFIGRFFYVTGLIVFLWISVVGIYSALTGRMRRLPVISKISDKFVI